MSTATAGGPEEEGSYIFYCSDKCQRSSKIDSFTPAKLVASTSSSVPATPIARISGLTTSTSTASSSTPILAGSKSKKRPSYDQNQQTYYPAATAAISASASRFSPTLFPGPIPPANSAPLFEGDNTSTVVPLHRKKQKLNPSTTKPRPPLKVMPSSNVNHQSHISLPGPSSLPGSVNQNQRPTKLLKSLWAPRLIKKSKSGP